jgi:UDP:flavonoid glycosyltransferase YjiC (YdhE family)
MSGYALFTAIPLVGHLNPLIRQAEELRRRGWRVAVACMSEMRAHVEAESPGTAFVDLGPLGAIADALRADEEAASRDRHFGRGTMRILRGLTAVWPAMYDGLRASVAADRPDVMVVDLFTSAGLSVADAAGVPFAINNPDLLASIPVSLLPPADDVPFLFSGRSIRDVGWGQRLAGPIVRRLAYAAAYATVGRDLNALRATRGLAAVGLDTLLRGRTIMVDGAFGLEYTRPLPPDIHMVGPMLPAETPPIPADLSRWLDEGAPVVYVNMGTMAVASDAQLQAMLEALSGETFRALWILKAPQLARLPQPLPSSVRVLAWGPPPLAVLAHPNVRVFVSHCGINSVHESLTAGTPIVGIPMFADQRDMAVRVADAGVGLWLDKSRFSAGDLRGAVVRVLTEEPFRRAIPAVQQALAAAGGVRRAADLIDAVAAGHAATSLAVSAAAAAPLPARPPRR